MQTAGYAIIMVPCGGRVGWQAPGLKLVGGESDAGVTKLPSLNCSTIDDTVVWSGLKNTVKCRSNMSFAQSFPQVPESVEPLAYGPKCWVEGSMAPRAVRSVIENASSPIAAMSDVIPGGVTPEPVDSGAAKAILVNANIKHDHHKAHE
jgi:hypothetical protein